MTEPDKPKKRFGCLKIAAKCAAVLLALLIPFVYWNFVRNPPPKISKETTYITGPLTSDGKRVDYFAALEQEFYPPGMKTDDNGYRLVVRALGDVKDDYSDKSRTAQAHKKLGLDPTDKPRMCCSDPESCLWSYCKTNNLDRSDFEDLQIKPYEPWTLESLPMMKGWLEQNGPVLDLLAEAVRKPAYCCPLVRTDEDGPLIATVSISEEQRTRQFARMLVARANYRIGVGEIDGAIDDLMTCERLGRHVERQPTATARIAGIMVQEMGAAVGLGGGRSRPTKEQLQRFAAELDALPPRPGLDRTRLSERFFTMDYLQWMASQRASIDAAYSLAEPVDRITDAIALHMSVDWNLVMRRANDRFDNWEQGSVTPRRTLLSPSTLLVGPRSRRAADLILDDCMLPLSQMRETIRRSICIDNLRRITLAMLIYAGEHGSLPPAYTVDGNGQPLQSWRVLLLPYLGERELFDKIRLEEAWDSMHNRRFHGATVAVYQCPSEPLKSGQTSYSVVVGETTAFRAGKGRRLDDLGMKQILVLERNQFITEDTDRNPICWMDPTCELTQDMVARESDSRPKTSKIQRSHPNRFNVGCRDGSASDLSSKIERVKLKGLVDGTSQ
jgi:hypothetical protein